MDSNEKWVVKEVRGGRWRHIYGPSSCSNCIRRLREIVEHRVAYEDAKVLKSTETHYTLGDCALTTFPVRKRKQ